MGRPKVLLALVAGALLPLSYAPFDFWPALVVGLALSFWLICDVTSLRQGLFLGWLIGVGKYAMGASWVYVSIHEQGGASESLAGVLVGLFVAGMALFSAIFGGLYAVANARQRSVHSQGFNSSGLWLRIGLFAASWIIAEWCLTWLLTGFPWLFAGYGLMPTWLVGFAPVTGVLGLSFMACVLGATLAVVLSMAGLKRTKTGLVVLCAGLLGAGCALQQVHWVTLEAPRQVALVQGNIEQISKWNPENRLPILEAYQQLSEPHWGSDLMVWPEAAITLFAQQAAPWLGRWDARGKASGTTLMLGLPDVTMTADGSQTFQNTALALGQGSGRYVKRRLVPFGEYVPFEVVLRGLIQLFDLPMSRSASGPADQPPIQAGGTALGTAICYEIAYPELVRLSAKNTDVLVTISNDAWFGASIGPHQHLQLAQMRALENGRYVLRSTNNGLTAIVNERGVITQSLPQFESGVLRGSYHPAQGRTLFNRLGHWPVLLIAALLLAGGILGGKRGGILRNA